MQMQFVLTRLPNVIDNTSTPWPSKIRKTVKCIHIKGSSLLITTTLTYWFQFVSRSQQISYRLFLLLDLITLISNHWKKLSTPIIQKLPYVSKQKQEHDLVLSQTQRIWIWYDSKCLFVSIRKWKHDDEDDARQILL